ncbi:MAG: hypothetical protein HY746_07150 [Elusimicrobia bacterium]|nr:hypothetical protein [Elusimicrobiota bacterium]
MKLFLIISVGVNLCFAVENQKVGVSKPSLNSWYNEISKPDCRLVNFSPVPETTQSETIHLESAERMEYCVEGRNCKAAKPGGIHKKNVRIEIHPATTALAGGPGQMYPWEYNLFKICLKGYRLWVEQIETAYDYRILQRNEGHLAIFAAEPGPKLAMDPDPDGIGMESFGYNAGIKAFEIALRDKWSGYYQEKTEIRVALYKDGFWSDKKIGEWIFTEKVSPQYRITLAAYITGSLGSGKYYVRWKFRRLDDRVSNAVSVDKGKTQAIKVIR